MGEVTLDDVVPVGREVFLGQEAIAEVLSENFLVGLQFREGFVGDSLLPEEHDVGENVGFVVDHTPREKGVVCPKRIRNEEKTEGVHPSVRVTFDWDAMFKETVWNHPRF